MTPETFKERLEVKLDETFPKGECAERGQALVLFAEAVMLFRESDKEMIKKIEEMRMVFNPENMSGDFTDPVAVKGYNEALFDIINLLKN